MDNLNFSRSRALNNIPVRKLKEALDAIKNSTDDLAIQNIKLIAINRYAESNIPLEYWNLKMERDFNGDPRLLAKYNEYTADLKESYFKGKSICFAGSHGVGKQLSLDTELPTPSGFIKLSDLKNGDSLFDENGDICKVTELHPINLSPESYKITFDDGSEVDACADHQWLTYTRRNRAYGTPPTVKNTKYILNSLSFKNEDKLGFNHSIPCCKPINYSNQNLLIDPYTLGCWLVDGNIKSNDKELINNTISNEYSVLLKNKCIPDLYLIADYKQRLELLQGLMDTNGSVLKNGQLEFCSVVSDLAYQVKELISSLGIKCTMTCDESWLYNKRCEDRYRINFATKLPVFKLHETLKNVVFNTYQLNKTYHRYIVDIKKIKPKPMRCITVDSPSHLFLITRSFIVTHNTMATTSILKKASQKGFSCQYSDITTIVSALTQASSEEKYIVKRELSLVDFLVIDEVDPRFFDASISSNELFAKNIENIFRSRRQNKLPTLICTNSPNLIESFSGTLKHSLGSLFYDKLEIMSVIGQDFRKVKDAK